MRSRSRRPPASEIRKSRRPSPRWRGRTSSDPAPGTSCAGAAYRATPDADPIYLYTDDVIGILPKRNLNNGQPSIHAALIAAAAPQPGEHVLHIGVGYYTAILAELVGATGKGDGDRIRWRARRPRDGEFCASAACPRGARRRH